MKTGHLIAGLALVVAAMLPAAAVAKHGTTDEQAYIGPAAVFGISFRDDHPPNVGFAGFSVGHADEVTITIDDTSDLTTSGVAFVLNESDETLLEDGPPDREDLDPRNGNEELLAQDAFCGSSQTFTLPEEATTVEVFVGPIDAISSALYYGEEPPVCPGPGTTGEVEATWG